MTQPLFTITDSTTFKLVKHDHAKDILYYEGGWWMSGDTHRELEQYRFGKEYSREATNGYVVAPRANKETKEIELDKFILPKTLH